MATVIQGPTHTTIETSGGSITFAGHQIVMTNGSDEDTICVQVPSDLTQFIQESISTWASVRQLRSRSSSNNKAPDAKNSV
jgi:hypothetical protein